MDGVSWRTSRSQEAFRGRSPASNTLTRLASFIARADTKQGPNHPSQSSQIPHLSAYVCPECGDGFPTSTDLRGHQEVRHSLPKPHRCPSCGKHFSLRSSLMLHRCARVSSGGCEVCRGVSLLGSSCPVCTIRAAADPGRAPPDKPLPLFPPLPLSLPLPRQPPPRGPYACAPCGRGFAQKQALLQHQQAGCCCEPSPPATGANAVATTTTTATICIPDDSPPVSDAESSHSDASDSPGPSRRCPVAMATRHGHGKEEEGEGKGRSSRLNGGLKDGLRSNRKLQNCRSELYVQRREKANGVAVGDGGAGLNEEEEGGRGRGQKLGAYLCQVCSKAFVHHLSLRAHYRQHAATAKNRPIRGVSGGNGPSERGVSGGNGPSERGVSGGNGPSENELPESSEWKRWKGQNPLTLTRRNHHQDPNAMTGRGRPGEAGATTANGAKANAVNANTVSAKANAVSFNAVNANAVNPKAFKAKAFKANTANPDLTWGLEPEEEEEKEEDDEEEEEEDEEFPCPSCPEVFPLLVQLREHVELHQAAGARRRCGVCAGQMEARRGPGSRRQRPYHCMPCQRGFPTLDAFLTHCQEHLRLRVEEDRLQEDKS
ncbi:uncharacterized protein ACNS7B_007757 isoform 1-T3 [Menidia menidia]